MSVDIAWDQITTGPDGAALAESIRAFVHNKFQQTTLPRFINSVNIHTFDFGSTSPSIEIKDICDPLSDFYEDEQTDSESSASSPLNLNDNGSRSAGSHVHGHQRRSSRSINDDPGNVESVFVPRATPAAPLVFSHARTMEDATTDTPGIPGGTSNMGYFHFPLSGMSGTQTPLAAVAGGGAFAQAWLNDQQYRTFQLNHRGPPSTRPEPQRDSNTDRPRTSDSLSSPELDSPFLTSLPDGRGRRRTSAEKVRGEADSSNTPDRAAVPLDRVQPSDVQVVARVIYDGDIHMSLTAQILLDYPMPSFVNIPLKLSITGMSFDGVAILAYIRKKMHFCFLDPEDADTLVGSSMSAEERQALNSSTSKSTFGGLLQEIRVETEIGRQESGKQVLKNVSKVERFVLEQVRRIFEEEFVFPSFWTFLV